MMHKPQKACRTAIAMIELIFAIVVMGIVMMSAPMILNQARQSATQGFNQESIAAIASQASMIFTYQWDENDTNQSIGAPMLNVTNGAAELNETVGNTGVRIGMQPTGSSRSFRINTGGRLAAGAALGLDIGEIITNMDTIDDIDDFDTQVIGLTPIGGIPNANGDYIDRQIQIRAAVAYAGDQPAAGYARTIIPFNFPAAAAATTNIKTFTIRLNTTLADADLQKDIILQGFTCNIGSYRNELRTF